MHDWPRTSEVNTIESLDESKKQRHPLSGIRPRAQFVGQHSQPLLAICVDIHVVKVGWAENGQLVADLIQTIQLLLPIIPLRTNVLAAS